MRYIILVLFLTSCAAPLMPHVERKTPEEINAIFCPGGGCLETIALYNKVTYTITLADTFDPKNEFDLSTLLHEFTHHLQNINGEKRSRCRGDRERQAYEVQRTFLKERGHKDTDKVMGIDLFTQFIITQCGE